MELPGVGSQAKLPVGSLELRFELLPSPDASPDAHLDETEVLLQLKSERATSVAYTVPKYDAYRTPSGLPRHANSCTPPRQRAARHAAARLWHLRCGRVTRTRLELYLLYLLYLL